MLKLHVQIFILTSDAAYLPVYLKQFKKGEGYDVYFSIKSQVPDIQRHAPSKIQVLFLAMIFSYQFRINF